MKRDYSRPAIYTLLLALILMTFGMLYQSAVIQAQRKEMRALFQAYSSCINGNHSVPGPQRSTLLTRTL